MLLSVILFVAHPSQQSFAASQDRASSISRGQKPMESCSMPKRGEQAKAPEFPPLREKSASPPAPPKGHQEGSQLTMLDWASEPLHSG